MKPVWRKVLDRVGTVIVVLVMLAGGGLVWWNMCGQGPYRDSCRYSLGCRSFYCLSHALQGELQVRSDGYCTQSCDADKDCGEGYRCVALSAAARDDLPPLGKPDRACMRLLPTGGRLGETAP
jgi:hypothetical protein